MRLEAPTQTELSDYLDGELAPSAQKRVIEWLLENPDAALNLMRSRLRDDYLRAAICDSIDQDGEAGDNDAPVYRRFARRHSSAFASRNFVYGLASGAFLSALLAAMLLTFS